MPIFRYRCTRCDEIFHALQLMSDPSPQKCERCHSTKVERLLGVPSLQFKGKGFYVTDVGKAAADGAKSKANKQEGAIEGKKDSKIGSAAKSAQATS